MWSDWGSFETLTRLSLLFVAVRLLFGASPPTVKWFRVSSSFSSSASNLLAAPKLVPVHKS